jgi:O-antigen ligase
MLIVARLDAETSAGPAVDAAIDADTLIRSALFVAVFLVVWISFHPFKDLADPLPAVAEGGDVANQIGYSVIFLVLSAWTWFNQPARLALLLRPALIATLAWFALSVVTSWEPSLAARRLTFMLIIMSISAMVLLLPKNLRHFSDLLAIVVLVVLATCYLGVLLVPQLAVHQVTDFMEPEHAGNWRGVFQHKNEAGANMVLFIFIGLFVARTRSLALGSIIVALAAIFLAFTQSKTAIGMLVPVLVISHVIARSRRPFAGIAIVVTIVASYNLFSVGTVLFEPIRRLIESIVPDATFTGRTEIWQFGLDHVMVHPLFGYGFGAFWGTDHVVYGMSENSSWVNAAEHAHNSYLNLAITVGLPGLALVLLWGLILPIVDFYRLPPDASSRPLQILFLRACLFGLLASCFESVIFQELAEGSFLFLIGVLGLRYLAVTRLRF